MNRIPAAPKLYHITHLDNLPQIISAGGLLSDAERVMQGLGATLVGMSDIKQRRLERLEVKCHPGTKVGEYVPFYFCPRSIMLYILHMGNHPDITYRGGQQPILHLQADLRRVVAWANQQGSRWAFTDRNAGAAYAAFFNDLNSLDRINWQAVAATDFRDPVIKEGKQAEFLVHRFFPWNLVERIGVFDTQHASYVNNLLAQSAHSPIVNVERTWYY